MSDSKSDDLRMMERASVNAQITVIEPEQLEYLPAKTLLRLVERSQAAQKNLKTFKQTVNALPELFRRFEELDLDVGFNLESTYINLTFTGDGDKLKAVWSVLRRHGFNTSLRPAKGDTTFNAFWTREGHAEIFMMFSSSLCRRVKVGTKMVEQPIYETQCGELPEIDVEVPATAVVVSAEDENDIPF